MTIGRSPSITPTDRRIPASVFRLAPRGACPSLQHQSAASLLFGKPMLAESSTFSQPSCRESPSSDLPRCNATSPTSAWMRPFGCPMGAHGPLRPCEHASMRCGAGMGAVTRRRSIIKCGATCDTLEASFSNARHCWPRCFGFNPSGV